MLTRGKADRNNQELPPQDFVSLPCERLKAMRQRRLARSGIAYSIDTLIPGFYLWFGPLKIRLGGSEAEENYSGTIHSFAGIALVLPSYRIYSTYQGSYDP